eukprot:11189780-Lingulodinium_polyedra.AAC.1
MCLRASEPSCRCKAAAFFASSRLASTSAQCWRRVVLSTEQPRCGPRARAAFLGFACSGILRAHGIARKER